MKPGRKYVICYTFYAVDGRLNKASYGVAVGKLAQVHHKQGLSNLAVPALILVKQIIDRAGSRSYQNLQGFVFNGI